MKRTVLTVVAVFVTLAMLAPSALAQAPAPAAPAPRVTINGLVDNLTSWSKNMSVTDANFDRSGEKEWYARTRVRPDITAEVGTTKFVLGLEIDFAWGTVNAGGADVGGQQRAGASSAADINTDMLGNIEMKWAYVDFALPFLPPGSTMRIGAQPFGSLATYKLAAYANGDFAGAVVSAALGPQFKLNLGYAQVEEAVTGVRDGFTRGDDYAAIASVDLTLFKGLDIKPMFSIAHFDGITSGASRQGRGGVANAAAFFPIGSIEDRYTIGADMRWRIGPISIEPTALFQWGDREVVGTVGSTAGLRRDQDIKAFLIDLRAGFQAGPLLIEGAGIYTSGNKSSEDIRDSGTEVNFYQPLSTDTSYYATWAEIFALGIDYFNILYSGVAGLNPGAAIGYDKYGLMRLGARATYAFTPAFSIRAGVTGSWTAEEVDTGSTLTAAGGLTPSAAASGDDRYLGTELNLGFTWRFAPNIALDMVGGYLIAGDALAYAAGPTGPSPDPDDVQTIVARIRYTF